MNDEWRFHPPTSHCPSCPLPFLSNLGTQETAEHVLNSARGSHGSISLDSSYPRVVLFLRLTWVMPGLFFAMTPPRLAPLTSIGWDGDLQPLDRARRAEERRMDKGKPEARDTVSECCSYRLRGDRENEAYFWDLWCQILRRIRFPLNTWLTIRVEMCKTSFKNKIAEKQHILQFENILFIWLFFISSFFSPSYSSL